jgi:2-hydroxy-6-oxonona-2,4-dienedioate hydrolase
MSLPLTKEGDFTYYESASTGEPLLLLHGLFGALSNFGDLISTFSGKYRVVIPILPIFELPITEAGVGGLMKHVDAFIKYKKFTRVHLLGNSLGGHVGLLYAINHPALVGSMILTGSSGLFESAFGNDFPRRNDYEYMRNKTAGTFYDPATATKELVDEVFSVVNDRMKALRIVLTAKSAVRHNLEDQLHKITIPVLLIWGQQDIVTPPFVGTKFHELLVNSELHFIDKCGHAPMMERPAEFNAILAGWLDRMIKSEDHV